MTLEAQLVALLGHHGQRPFLLWLIASTLSVVAMLIGRSAVQRARAGSRTPELGTLIA